MTYSQLNSWEFFPRIVNWQYERENVNFLLISHLTIELINSVIICYPVLIHSVRIWIWDNCEANKRRAGSSNFNITHTPAFVTGPEQDEIINSFIHLISNMVKTVKDVKAWLLDEDFQDCIAEYLEVLCRLFNLFSVDCSANIATRVAAEFGLQAICSSFDLLNMFKVLLYFLLTFYDYRY